MIMIVLGKIYQAKRYNLYNRYYKNLWFNTTKRPIIMLIIDLITNKALQFSEAVIFKS